MTVFKKNKVLTGFIMAACLMLVAMLHGTEVKAEGNYYLQVNKGTNVVTVFNNDGTPNRAFACSDGNDTPLGTYYTQAKYVWKELYFQSYGQYSTRITGSILFHSVPYNAQRKDAQSYRAYNKLGETASHGCVRLTTEAAKWIYDNCPLKTRVTIIDGTAMNDPLGKPATIRVNAALGQGWDPTDPDPANPYAASAPSIALPSTSHKITYGKKTDVKAGVIAYDSLGNNITDQMTVNGSVNVKKLGSYNITYSITDALGRSASSTVTFKVVDTKKATIKGVKSKLTKEYRSTFSVKKGVTAKTVNGKKLTKKIKVKVVYPGSKKEKTYKKSKIRFTKVGTYKIVYYVTNPNNKKVTKKTCKVTVKDTKAPVMYGVSASKTAEYNSTIKPMSNVTAKKVSGTSLTKSIQVAVKLPGSTAWRNLSSAQKSSFQLTSVGTYQFRYVAVNKTSKKSITKYMQVTVVDTKAPVITLQSGFAAMLTPAGTASYTYSMETGTALSLGTGQMSAKLSCGIATSMSANVSDAAGKNLTTFDVSNASAYTFAAAGTYTVAINATNPNNAKAFASIKIVVTVVDPEPETPVTPETPEEPETPAIPEASAETETPATSVAQEALEVPEATTEAEPETESVETTEVIEATEATEME